MAYGMSGKIFHAPFIFNNPAFTFYAITERNQKRVQQDYEGVISYGTADELINDPAIELMVVNTPNNTHFDYARQALLAGKHVLIEKPAATTAIEVGQLFDLGRKQDKKVLIYQNRRWSSDFVSARKIVEEGRLGQIIEAHFRYDRYRKLIGPKTFKETPIPGSGILFDLGAHMLDQAISLFGQPLGCRKTLGTYRPNSKVDDYASLHLKFPNQLNVYVTVSLLVADPQPGIIIHGTEGSFVKSFCDTQEEQIIAGKAITDRDFGFEPVGSEGRLTIFNERDEKITELVPSGPGRYMDIFDAVYENIRNNKPFPVTEEQILAQMHCLEKPADD